MLLAPLEANCPNGFLSALPLEVPEENEKGFWTSPPELAKGFPAAKFGNEKFAALCPAGFSAESAFGANEKTGNEGLESPEGDLTPSGDFAEPTVLHRSAHEVRRCGLRALVRV